ncbi:BatD family protein [Frigidibacter mobilis]|nr:BatD family protein [Frigidibacter mobilis]
MRLALCLLLLPLPALAEGRLELDLIARPTHKEIVVGEMVPVTLRGIYERSIAREDLVIAPTDAFDWIQLAQDDWHRERIDGRSYMVMERKLALFPKRSGPGRFGPAEHSLTIITAASQRAEAMVRASPIELSVGAFPMERGWKFAASDVTLQDDLSTDPAALEDGATVTRTVTLRAHGVLPEMLPPRPVVSENWLITFAAPVERQLELTPDGPVASVTWTWQFRPETGEPGVLEPVVIPYFDTETRQMAQVEIPALPIGYASFKENQVDAGRFSAGSRWLLAAAFLAGLGAGAAVLARWYRPDRARLVAARLVRHWSPVPRWHLRQAARSGDLLALRGAAEQYLRPEEAVDPALRHAALARLDAAIYGRGPAVFDTARFAADLRRAARRGLRSTGSRPRPAPGAALPPPR